MKKALKTLILNKNSEILEFLNDHKRTDFFHLFGSKFLQEFFLVNYQLIKLKFPRATFCFENEDLSCLNPKFIGISKLVLIKQSLGIIDMILM